MAARAVARGHAGAHRQGYIDVGERRDERFQDVPDQGRAGSRGEAVGQLPDLDWAHA